MGSSEMAVVGAVLTVKRKPLGFQVPSRARISSCSSNQPRSDFLCAVSLGCAGGKPQAIPGRTRRLSELAAPEGFPGHT